MEKETGEQKNNNPLVKGLGLLPMVWVIFSVVCGGPYGLEESISTTGPGLGLLLIILTPFFWSMPISYMAAELASSMPEEGGYVKWIKRAMGHFWSFQIGWLAWIRNIVESTLYPVLFIEYLKYFFPQAGEAAFHWSISIALIGIFTILNLLGVAVVGESSIIFSIIVLLPFIIMTVLGLSHFDSLANMPFIPNHNELGACFGAGLLIIIWNYNGWEDFSTCLGEVKEPQKNYARALRYAIPMIIATYLLTILASLAGTRYAIAHGAAGTGVDWSQWASGIYPKIGQVIGGNWLGMALSIAILIGLGNQLSTILLSTSRIPYALATEKYLPPIFAKVSKKTGVPWFSLLSCSVAIALLSGITFSKLVEIDIYLYAIVLIMEFSALFILRFKEPNMPRPIKIPGGIVGVAAMALLPLTILVLAVGTAVKEIIEQMKELIASMPHAALIEILKKAFSFSDDAILTHLAIFVLAVILGLALYYPLAKRYHKG